MARLDNIMISFFDGNGDILAGLFGGKVTVQYGTEFATDVDAIFRLEPRLEPVGNGSHVETLVPVLRASRIVIDNLSEGDLINPDDGHIYKFLFSEESPNPASDALVPAQLEKIS